MNPRIEFFCLFIKDFYFHICISYLTCISLIYLCVWVVGLPISICAKCVQYLQRPKEGVRISGTRAIVAVSGCGEPNLGPEEKQQALFTAEPSLQSSVLLKRKVSGRKGEQRDRRKDSNAVNNVARSMSKLKWVLTGLPAWVYLTGE